VSYPEYAVKLTITRGGGLAGLTRETALASDTLPPDQVAKLHELVDGAGLLGDAARREAPPVHPDELGYEVTVEHDGRTSTQRFTEQTLPDSVRSLIGWVDSRPEHRQSILPP